MPDETQASSPPPSNDGAADPSGSGPAGGPAGGDTGTSNPGDPSSTGSGLRVPDESMSCDAEALPDVVASAPPSTPPQEAPSVTVAAAEGEDPADGEEAAAEEAAPAAAVEEEPPEDSPVKRETNHVSSKYTEEQLMARHYGMSMAQAKRVKALLMMGVCEEDLAVADRLLKLGRCAVYGYVANVQQYAYILCLGRRPFCAQRNETVRFGSVPAFCWAVVRNLVCSQCWTEPLNRSVFRVQPSFRATCRSSSVHRAMSAAFLATKNESVWLDFRVVKHKQNVFPSVFLPSPRAMSLLFLIPRCRDFQGGILAMLFAVAGHIARVLCVHSTKRFHVQVTQNARNSYHMISPRLEPKMVRYRGGRVGAFISSR